MRISPIYPLPFIHKIQCTYLPPSLSSFIRKMPTEESQSKFNSPVECDSILFLLETNHPRLVLILYYIFILIGFRATFHKLGLNLKLNKSGLALPGSWSIHAILGHIIIIAVITLKRSENWISVFIGGCVSQNRNNTSLIWNLCRPKTSLYLTAAAVVVSWTFVSCPHWLYR